MSTTMFEAAGGAAGVSNIVEAFYRRIEADAFMRSLYPEDLEPGKAKLKLFFEQWLGGGPVYSQKYGHPRLRARHFPFVIGDRHAGLWLRYMREAWHECGVPAEVESTAFERLGPLARHMVNEGQDVPREPIGDAFLQ